MLEYLLVKKMGWGYRGHICFCVPAPTSISARRRLKTSTPSPSIRPTSFIEDDVWKLLMTQGAKTVSNFQFPTHMMRMSPQRCLFIDFLLLLLASPSFPGNYVPVSGSCCMSCTKQVMMPGSYNCRTLLLKIIFSLLIKYFYIAKTFPNSSMLIFMLKKKKGEQTKIFLPLMPPFCIYSANVWWESCNREISLLVFCLFTNLARVLKLRITSHLSKCFKQLLHQTTLNKHFN